MACTAIFMAAVTSPYLILPAALVVLAASSAVFWALVRRWTTQRRWVMLADWAADHGFVLRRSPVELPAVVGSSLPGCRVHVALEDRAATEDARTLIAQVEASIPPAGAPPGTAPVWNLLVRRLTVSWPAAGLRPAGHPTSVLDYFSLTAFPLVAVSQQRFSVVGADLPAARALAHSPIRALMPADIGILLIDDRLILDFSRRPLDHLELHRITGLAEQLVAHLPRLTRPSPAQNPD